MQVSIAPTPQTQALLSQLEGGKRGPQAKALQKAVSLTLTTARAELARAVHRHVRMNIGDIKGEIKLHRGSWDDASGAITLRKRRVPLAKYAGAAQKKSVLANVAKSLWSKVRKSNGIKVNVRKVASGKYPAGAQVVKGGFWAMLKSGHLGIYRRKGKKRFPIAEALGPSPFGIAMNAAGEEMATVRQDVAKHIETNLEKNLRNAIRFRLSQQGR